MSGKMFSYDGFCHRRMTVIQANNSKDIGRILKRRLTLRLKNKISVSESCRPHLFFCAHLILQNSDFQFFFLNFFFLTFTTKNKESLLFWKNLSTLELKKRVKSRLVSENTEVETFQSFLVSDVRGGKGQLKLKKK